MRNSKIPERIGERREDADNGSLVKCEARVWIPSPHVNSAAYVHSGSQLFGSTKETGQFSVQSETSSQGKTPNVNLRPSIHINTTSTQARTQTHTHTPQPYTKIPAPLYLARVTDFSSKGYFYFKAIVSEPLWRIVCHYFKNRSLSF